MLSKNIAQDDLKRAIYRTRCYFWRLSPMPFEDLDPMEKAHLDELATRILLSLQPKPEGLAQALRALNDEIARGRDATQMLP
jgi:hypothetical protein